MQSSKMIIDSSNLAIKFLQSRWKRTQSFSSCLHINWIRSLLMNTLRLSNVNACNIGSIVYTNVILCRNHFIFPHWIWICLLQPTLFDGNMMWFDRRVCRKNLIRIWLCHNEQFISLTVFYHDTPSMHFARQIPSFFAVQLVCKIENNTKNTV